MPQSIREVMADVFSVPVDTITDDGSPETIPGWDSLHHLELMMALELEYGVHISSDVMPVLLSVEAVEGYLAEQGVQSSA